MSTITNMAPAYIGNHQMVLLEGFSYKFTMNTHNNRTTFKTLPTIYSCKNASD